MKIRYNIIAIAVALLTTVGFTSCDDDDFTASIFDTTDYPLDKTAYTFPLDTFVKVNFLEPYNLRYVYKMEDIGSDMQKNLVPATYDASVKLAVLSKYLWYDVYKTCAGEDFIKTYTPRIIHVIGSPSYNPSSGTETLGTAEGGLKITLYNVNNIDENDIDMMNEKFFKTMHHEFGHILAQNYTYPTSFSMISRSNYNASDWQNSPDSLVAGQGFVSPYASSQVREDWVEVLANYIVKDDQTWNGLLNTASYDWEKVDVDADKFDRDRYTEGVNLDSVGYFVEYGTRITGTSKYSTYKVVRKVIDRDADDNPVLTDGKMTYLDSDGIDGKAVILQKLELVRTWLKDNFGISLDDLRAEVQGRQWVTNADGTLKLDSNGHYINHLTYPLESDPSRNFMDTLLDEVNKYKELQ